jgi:predicted nucleic acid-binding protein
VVDSSGWLEYITLDTKAEAAAKYIEGSRPIVVPTIVIYEVFKKLSLSWGKVEADRFASQAMRRQVVPLDETVALAAARTSLQLKLAMADAIIYTTARLLQAELITSDQAFSGLPGVTLL